MSQVEVERFLGRIITDADFRGRATASLNATCYGEGIALSLQELQLLSQLDFQPFDKMADALDDAIKRS